MLLYRILLWLYPRPLREQHGGIGKSWLASAFVESACRHGWTATYVRAPRLLHELAVSRGDGSYARLLAKLAKLDLLAIDDWLLAPLTDAERRDLLPCGNIFGRSPSLPRLMS